MLALRRNLQTPMPIDTRALESDLRRRIAGEVRFDPYSRALYSTDASIYQMEPVGVVIPRDAADVAAVIATCAKAGVAVLVRVFDSVYAFGGLK